MYKVKHFQHQSSLSTYYVMFIINIHFLIAVTYVNCATLLLLEGNTCVVGVL